MLTTITTTTTTTTKPIHPPMTHSHAQQRRGFLAPPQFRTALEETLNMPLTDDQLGWLMTSFDCNGDAGIDYNEVYICVRGTQSSFIVDPPIHSSLHLPPFPVPPHALGLPRRQGRMRARRRCRQDGPGVGARAARLTLQGGGRRAGGGACCDRMDRNQIA
jgi:hypothetical protein